MRRSLLETKGGKEEKIPANYCYGFFEIYFYFYQRRPFGGFSLNWNELSFQRDAAIDEMTQFV